VDDTGGAHSEFDGLGGGIHMEVNHAHSRYAVAQDSLIDKAVTRCIFFLVRALELVCSYDPPSLGNLQHYYTHHQSPHFTTSSKMG